MEITVSKTHLLDTLSGVLSAVEPRNLVLQNIKVTLGDNSMTVLATDMDVFAQARMETPATDNVEFLVPGKTFQAILQRCGETITLRKKETATTIESGNYSVHL